MSYDLRKTANITCHISFRRVIVTKLHTESFPHATYSTWSCNIISHERLRTGAAPEMSKLRKRESTDWPHHVRSHSPGPRRTCQDAPLLTRMEPIQQERERAGSRQCADKRMQNRGDFLNGKNSKWEFS